jgi:stress response protein SCP2
MIPLTPGRFRALQESRQEVTVRWKPRVPADVDIFAFLCGSDGLIHGDADVLFYKQPRAPGNVASVSGGGESTSGRLIVDTPSLPAETVQVWLCLAANGPIDELLESICFEVEGYAYTIYGEECTSGALCGLKLVRGGTSWRVSAVQGEFEENAAALVERFGGQTSDREEDAAQPEASPPLPAVADREEESWGATTAPRDHAWRPPSALRREDATKVKVYKLADGTLAYLDDANIILPRLRLRDIVRLEEAIEVWGCRTQSTSRRTVKGLGEVRQLSDEWEDGVLWAVLLTVDEDSRGYIELWVPAYVGDVPSVLRFCEVTEDPTPTEDPLSIRFVIAESVWAIAEGADGLPLVPLRIDTSESPTFDVWQSHRDGIYVDRHVTLDGTTIKGSVSYRFSVRPIPGSPRLELTYHEPDEGWRSRQVAAYSWSRPTPGVALSGNGECELAVVSEGQEPAWLPLVDGWASTIAPHKQVSIAIRTLGQSGWAGIYGLHAAGENRAGIEGPIELDIDIDPAGAVVLARRPDAAPVYVSATPVGRDALALPKNKDLAEPERLLAFRTGAAMHSWSVRSGRDSADDARWIECALASATQAIPIPRRGYVVRISGAPLGDGPVVGAGSLSILEQALGSPVRLETSVSQSNRDGSHLGRSLGAVGEMLPRGLPISLGLLVDLRATHTRLGLVAIGDCFADREAPHVLAKERLPIGAATVANAVFASTGSRLRGAEACKRLYEIILNGGVSADRAAVSVAAHGGLSVLAEGLLAYAGLWAQRVCDPDGLLGSMLANQGRLPPEMAPHVAVARLLELGRAATFGMALHVWLEGWGWSFLDSRSAWMETTQRDELAAHAGIIGFPIRVIWPEDQLKSATMRSLRGAPSPRSRVPEDQWPTVVGFCGPDFDAHAPWGAPMLRGAVSDASAGQIDFDALPVGLRRILGSNSTLLSGGPDCSPFGQTVTEGIRARIDGVVGA